jgi:hypothetical protein
MWWHTEISTFQCVEWVFRDSRLNDLKHLDSEVKKCLDFSSFYNMDCDDQNLKIHTEKCMNSEYPLYAHFNKKTSADRDFPWMYKLQKLVHIYKVVINITQEYQRINRLSLLWSIFKTSFGYRYWHTYGNSNWINSSRNCPIWKKVHAQLHKSTILHVDIKNSRILQNVKPPWTQSFQYGLSKNPPILLFLGWTKRHRPDEHTIYLCTKY